MIDMMVLSNDPQVFYEMSAWLLNHKLRLVAFGGKNKGEQDVLVKPRYHVDDGDKVFRYDIRFYESQAETAMLFKLTFGGQ